MKEISIKLPEEQTLNFAPCPFCNSNEVYWSDCKNFITIPTGSSYLRLVCRRCGSGTTSYPTDSLDKCVSLWNGSDSLKLRNERNISDHLASAIMGHYPLRAAMEAYADTLSMSDRSAVIRFLDGVA